MRRQPLVRCVQLLLRLLGLMVQALSVVQRVFFENFGRKSSPESVCVHSGVPQEWTVP